MYTQNFRRLEKKYLLSKEEYDVIMKKLKPYLMEDKYYKSTICNIYFDTKDFTLIQNSIEKPVYKEKIRLRSYFVPTYEDTVFLEIKKKYKGMVGKRRIHLTLQQFYDYFDNHVLPDCNRQISSELDYCFQYYQLEPKVFIAYDRLSYYSKENHNFRITFDTNIRSRSKDLRLELGDYGDYYFEKENYVMEIKTLDSFPIWFIKILEECHIYPTSFSKYGNIYLRKIKEELYV